MSTFGWVEESEVPAISMLTPVPSRSLAELTEDVPAIRTRGGTSLARPRPVSDGVLPNPAEWLRRMFYRGEAPAPHFEMHVVGIVAPQGSKVPGARLPSGRIPMRESSKKVKPWREDVTNVALDIVSPDQGKTLFDGFPLEGPLVGLMVFTMKKPVAAPKRRRTYPATKGNDSSKLVRSTEDALVKVRAIDDDGLIIDYLRIAKVFPGEDEDALAMPGAVIRFWAVDRLPELGA